MKWLQGSLKRMWPGLIVSDFRELIVYLVVFFVVAMIVFTVTTCVYLVLKCIWVIPRTLHTLVELKAATGEWGRAFAILKAGYVSRFQRAWRDQDGEER